MMNVEQLFQKMWAQADQLAVNWLGTEYSYGQLLHKADDWNVRLNELSIRRGSVCGVIGDYSPEVCAAFLALMRIGAILVPFTKASASQMNDSAALAGVQTLLTFSEDDTWTSETLVPGEPNELVTNFLKQQHPGLVVFTSGSTGQPKGILHDCELVLEKFMIPRTGYKTLLFLLMDHFGGFNTLMSVWAYGGTAVITPNRSPEEVCRTVEHTKAELLPITPTFLNLLLASKCYDNFDLTSVKLITYGTEVMSESTLQRVGQIFPSARLQQTYGLSELGVLRSRSKESDSVWVKVGGHGFETKVVDGTLHVKSKSAMVGYLNAPSPFDEDGWMDTGDHVEVEGDYLRIFGRESDIINVGGQKVLPIEVETALMEAPNVVEATVYGVANALMGHSVAASVSLQHDEDPILLKTRLRRACLERLAPYKVPVRFTVVPQSQQHNERLKKVRRPTSVPGAE